jgi:hypothetical protein
MTTQCLRKNLRPFYAKADAIILNGREGGQGNSAQARQPILAEPLQFANDTDRLTDLNLGAALRRTKLTHFNVSDNRAGSATQPGKAIHRQPRDKRFDIAI